MEVTMKLNAKIRGKLNDQIHHATVGLKDAIPIADFEKILAPIGLKLEEFILCGRSGSANINLFTLDGVECSNSMLALSWFKHESGRYDVNAYLS
jgi:hypothetical protein